MTESSTHLTGAGVNRNTGADFKRVMGHYPTGVVVVAAVWADAPHGMAVNSFTSVSLDPQLVMFCADHSSDTWPRIRAVGRFAVSVLSADQGSVCRRFAQKGADRFSAVRWSRNGSGQPVLDEAIAWLDCVVANTVAAGDHDIVVGRVLDAHDRTDGVPLVFHRGKFTGLRPGESS